MAGRTIGRKRVKPRKPAAKKPVTKAKAKVIAKKRVAVSRRRRSDIDTLADTAVLLPIAGTTTILAARLGG